MTTSTPDPGKEGRPTRARMLAIGAACCYLATFWLVLLHRLGGLHERSEPGLAAHSLRDATLALPVVLVAAWGAGRLADHVLAGTRASARLALAVRAALLGLATSFGLALGSPLHAWLFGAEGGEEPALPLHVLRDATLALPVALLAAVAGLTLAARAPRRPMPTPAPAPRPSAGRGRRAARS